MKKKGLTSIFIFSFMMLFALFISKTKESKALIVCEELYGGVGVCCIHVDGNCNVLDYTSGWEGPFYHYPERPTE